MGNLCKPCGVIQQRSCWIASEELDKQEICGGVTLRTLHLNNTHQSHLSAAFTLDNAFGFCLYLIRVTPLSDPRPNRRSGARSLRCKTETVEEEEGEKNKKNEHNWGEIRRRRSRFAHVARIFLKVRVFLLFCVSGVMEVMRSGTSFTQLCCCLCLPRVGCTNIVCVF